MDVLTSQDLEEMLAPLPGDSCGENCEYDDLYLALDTLAQGTPASEMGDSIIDGKDPDYRTLYKNCMTLWKKTRDLRVASFLTLSSLCIGGIEGLLGGLKVIDYLVTDLYDSFYPQLDPDDDNDPTERINILSMISPEQRKGMRLILTLSMPSYHQFLFLLLNQERHLLMRSLRL